MLPSLLARDSQTGLKPVLVAGFQPADAFLDGLWTRRCEDEAAWLNGLYGQMGLPFAVGSTGTACFDGFSSEFRGSQRRSAAGRLKGGQGGPRGDGPDDRIRAPPPDLPGGAVGAAPDAPGQAD